MKSLSSRFLDLSPKPFFYLHQPSDGTICVECLAVKLLTAIAEHKVYAKHRLLVCEVSILDLRDSCSLYSRQQDQTHGPLVATDRRTNEQASPHVNGLAFLPYRTMATRASCSRKSSASLSTSLWSPTTTALTFPCRPLFMVSQRFDEGYNGSYPTSLVSG